MSHHTKRLRFLSATAAITLPCIFAMACRKAASPGGGAATPAPASTALRPTGKFLFQPCFRYENREPVVKGTGFFLRVGDDRIAAVSSTECVELNSARLISVLAVGISLRDFEPVAKMHQSWGMPGSGGKETPVLDLRSDYFIMPVAANLPDDMLLELDERPAPGNGEAVWYPSKSFSHHLGYEWIEGVVDEIVPGHISVRLKKSAVLESQNGSPVISATTGKVIGVLFKGKKRRGRMVLSLCPAASIRNAIESAEEFPRLKDVVGRRGGRNSGNP